MEIRRNREIFSYFDRCRANLSNERINSFLNRRVTPASETCVRRQLSKAGVPEFAGSEADWPSLFIRVDEWENHPYHRTVTDRLRTLSGVYETEEFEGQRLFNSDAVQPDVNKELNDWMKLRALDRAAQTIVLVSNGIEWMLDAPGESITNDPPAEKAHGRVVTFGLGIGYYLFMALRNPEVDHVTVIEKDPAVIETFRNHLQPLFPDHNRFTIQTGDAMDFWNKAYLSSFDSIYADIWQSSDDGLFLMHELLKRYNPPHEAVDFWIEDSCVVPLRTLIFLHYEELVYRTRRQVNPDYEELMQCVRRWFKKDSRIIDNPQDLKEMMYDRKVLRAILGGN